MRYVGSLESSERTRDTTERLAVQCGKLAETVALMQQWICKLTGYVMEV